MKLDEIVRSQKILLTPDDVSEVMNCNPQDIRCQAAIDPTMLGFPVCRVGTRTKIPRIPFLRWLGLEVQS
jgi:hypothetical protein|nr:MAG TPA: Protein of unknown function (DUF1580) [Caudoviricetes sp.]